MSIALDVALYLRENNIIGLSLATRGVLFTLLFRIGSNPFCWLTQDALATECQVSVSNIRIHMNKLSELGLINISYDAQDKRKNIYSITRSLINYHQLPNRKVSKNYHLKVSANFKNTAQNQAVNTAQNQAVILDAQIATDRVTPGLDESAQIAKVKEQSNTKSKVTHKCASTDAQTQFGFDDFWNVYPRKKDKARAKEMWIKKKCYLLASEIIADVHNRVLNESSWKDEQYIPHARTYLHNARWEDEITLHKEKSSNKKETAVQIIDRQLRERGII